MNKIFFRLFLMSIFFYVYSSCNGKKKMTDEQNRNFKTWCMTTKMEDMDSVAASVECDCFVTNLNKYYPDGGKHSERERLMLQGCNNSSKTIDTSKTK